MRLTRRLMAVGIAGFLIGVGVGAGPAQANCCEIIGCSDKNHFKHSDLKKLGCQPALGSAQLDLQGNGYCFKTSKAIKAFGNAGCLYDDAALVPLNKFEKYNVNAIKKVEKQKGCS